MSMNDRKAVLQYHCYVNGLQYSPGSKSDLLARLANPNDAPKRIKYACQRKNAIIHLKMATKAFGDDHPLTVAAAHDLNRAVHS